MVFILYFQQATHVQPRPSLIVFDTYYVYIYIIYMEQNNVRVRYRPAFPLISLTCISSLPQIYYTVLRRRCHRARIVVIVYPKLEKRTVQNFRLILFTVRPNIPSPKRHMSSSARVTTKDNVIIRKNNIMINKILLLHRI